MASFKKAIKWMKEGKNVRRANWGAGVDIWRDGDWYYDVSSRDFEADDWEIYEEEEFCLKDTEDSMDIKVVNGRLSGTVKGEKQSFDSYSSFGHFYTDDVKKMCDLIIEDIKKGDFHISNFEEIFKIIKKRSGLYE